MTTAGITRVAFEDVTVDKGDWGHYALDFQLYGGDDRVILEPAGARGTALDPVSAFRAWTTYAGIDSGPLFRSVDRHGRVSEGPLSKMSAGRIVRRRARVGGLPEGTGPEVFRRRRRVNSMQEG